MRQFKKSKLLRLSCRFIAMIVFTCMCAFAQSQERTISGTITDNTGVGLPGVNVTVKGTTIGVVTDIDGKYSIKVQDNSAVLTVSYVGYATQEMPVGDKTALDFNLSENLQELNEVVVIGYGVQKKKLNTGATLNVGGDAIQALKTNSPMEALKGITPGVNIIQNNGLPGSGTKVNIRGVGTIGNSKPLYVVDGIVVGDIDYLSPSDIEAIDVLKDAASSAIYGSQAANGVILVTTKGGAKDAKTVVTYDGYYGISNMYKRPEPLNAKQYMEILDEAQTNDGKKPNDWAKLIPDQYNRIMNGEWNGTNWVDEIENKDAPTQSHSVNITGGSKKSTYSIGGSYFEEEGILGKQTNNKFQRTTVRLNTTNVIWENKNTGSPILTIGENLTYSNTKRPAFRTGSIYWNDFHNMLVTSPLFPVYAPDSTGKLGYSKSWNVDEVNPIASMEYNGNANYNNNHTINASAFAELQPLKGLAIRSSYGVNTWYGNSRSWVPVYNLSSKSYTTRDVVNQRMYNGNKWIWTNTATYSNNIEQHSFTLLAGQEMSKKNLDLEISGKNENSLFQDAEHAYLRNVPVVDANYTTLTGDDEFGDAILSYFGRVSYDYKETYMLTVVLRADGSSHFPKGHRWGTFPSVSAGWLISNESFMDGTKSWLNSLKFRASWGQNGNQDLTDNGKFQYLATQNYDASADYFFGLDKTVRTIGSYPNKVPNFDLTWETSEQTDLGLDMYIMNNRLMFTADYYIKETKGWLVKAPIAKIEGTDPAYSNGGTITNKGIELALKWNDRSGDFKYGASVTFAYNKNEVTALNTSDSIIHGQSNVISQGTGEMYRAEIGYPIGYFWGYKTDGVFQDTIEVEAFTKGKKSYYKTDPKTKKLVNSIKPGDQRYVDMNADTVINEKDKVQIGDPNPDFTLGLQFDVAYKGLYMLASANGQFGHQVALSYRSFVDGAKQNYTTDVYDRWHGPGTSDRFPRLSTQVSTNVSDVYIEDADYLRISNITVGYDFKNLFQALPMSEAKLYFSVKNLHTFTSYRGLDPEVGYAPDSWARGVDLGLYPSSRTYMVGVSLKF